MADKLIPLKTAALREARPDWPFSGWSTWKLVREGKLGCVRFNKRRIFVTPDHLAEYIAKHVQEARR